ncbi:biopolymer transporter ExbD [Oleiagrimonas sp. MCCC 1A03011]|uniref:ExbD/TolR family protein n=1 Tax=Oleiagrimonas sp. MCCC 1A03011 TaxID=1926883 RepID=UPI0011BDE6ED|nr:biopolymer transporter ExbD [Oleiagrimonas sp. MCCC 1A03011]
MSYLRAVENREAACRIDLTPLAGVLLVLLALFMLAIPESKRLTGVHNGSYMESWGRIPPAIHLVLTRHDRMFWNREVVSTREVHARLIALGHQIRQPSLQVFADDDVAWDRLHRILVDADNQGVNTIDLMSDPDLEGYR